ncbi:LAFA_0E12420g1_1 [Lachancea sp. 'fantastica']|nr:LAFA_0E12420g1_1 [Lachancea sp. 'fantastica']
MSQALGQFDRDGDSGLLAVSRGVVRHILALCESQSDVISRSRLTTLIREVSKKETSRKFRFAEVFWSMDKLLQDTFGYELVGLQAKNAPLNATKDKAQTFILVTTIRNLPADFKSLLVQEGRGMYGPRVVGDQYVGDDPMVLSETLVRESVSTDSDLVSQGLTLLILTIVLVSRNNLLLQELVESLEAFGIPSNGRQIPALNVTLEEFLKRLIKREYLYRKEENAPDGVSEVVSFRIGRKAQVEFPQSALIEACREIMHLPDEQIERLTLSIDLSVGDAYDETP